MAKRAPRKGEGRPTIFTVKSAEEICKRLALGESLRTICKDEKMPDISTVMAWILDPEKAQFSEQYRRAREAQAENMFDEILEIADDGSNDYMTITKGDVTYNKEDTEVTNRSKLRVNARQWYLSKIVPKKYGDKLDLTTDGEKLPTPIYGGASTGN